MAKMDRSTTPWLVAAWHPPWYSSYKAHYRDAECMRIAMEELLYSYGVDIVFNGHVSNDWVYSYGLLSQSKRMLLGTTTTHVNI